MNELKKYSINHQIEPKFNNQNFKEHFLQFLSKKDNCIEKSQIGEFIKHMFIIKEGQKLSK